MNCPYCHAYDIYWSKDRYYCNECGKDWEQVCNSKNI